MRKFRVSVNLVRCCDVYVNAGSAEEAKHNVLEGRLWREENDGAWCGGHEGTEQVGECVEVDDSGNEI